MYLYVNKCLILSSWCLKHLICLIVRFEFCFNLICKAKLPLTSDKLIPLGGRDLIQTYSWMAAEDFLLGFRVARAEAELLSMGALSICTRAKEKKNHNQRLHSHVGNAKEMQIAVSRGWYFTEGTSWSILTPGY